MLISEILQTLVIFQIFLLLVSPVLTHTQFSCESKAVSLVLTECDVWTAGARYLLSPVQMRLGGAFDASLILTECVLYVIVAGMA